MTKLLEIEYRSINKAYFIILNWGSILYINTYDYLELYKDRKAEMVSARVAEGDQKVKHRTLPGHDPQVKSKAA